MVRLLLLPSFVALSCISLTYGAVEPVVKATSFEDMPGTYYLSHKQFDFCSPELEISASGSLIDSLIFSGGGSRTPCGVGPWDTKTYPGGSAGWAQTMGTRVQSNLGIECGGITASLMIIRAERDYTDEEPMFGTEDKYYNYLKGVKYVTFAKNDVGTCIYAQYRLCDDGKSNYPGCGAALSTAAKAGIGAAAGVILLLSLCCLFFYFRKKNKANKENDNESGTGTSYNYINSSTSQSSLNKKKTEEIQPPNETHVNDDYYEPPEYIN